MFLRLNRQVVFVQTWNQYNWRSYIFECSHFVESWILGHGNSVCNDEINDTGKHVEKEKVKGNSIYMKEETHDCHIIVLWTLLHFCTLSVDGFLDVQMSR